MIRASMRASGVRSGRCIQGAINRSQTMILETEVAAFLPPPSRVRSYQNFRREGRGEFQLGRDKVGGGRAIVFLRVAF